MHHAWSLACQWMSNSNSIAHEVYSCFIQQDIFSNLSQDMPFHPASFCLSFSSSFALRNQTMGTRCPIRVVNQCISEASRALRYRSDASRPWRTSKSHRKPSTKRNINKIDVMNHNMIMYIYIYCIYIYILYMMNYGETTRTYHVHSHTTLNIYEIKGTYNMTILPVKELAICNPITISSTASMRYVILSCSTARLHNSKPQTDRIPWTLTTVCVISSYPVDVENSRSEMLSSSSTV